MYSTWKEFHIWLAGAIVSSDISWIWLLVAKDLDSNSEFVNSMLFIKKQHRMMVKTIYLGQVHLASPEPSNHTYDHVIVPFMQSWYLSIKYSASMQENIILICSWKRKSRYSQLLTSTNITSYSVFSCTRQDFCYNCHFTEPSLCTNHDGIKLLESAFIENAMILKDLGRRFSKNVIT